MIVTYRDREFQTGDITDIGYGSEKIYILDRDRDEIEIGGDKKIAQLFITFSSFSKQDLENIKEIDENLKNVKDILNSWLIIPNDDYLEFFKPENMQVGIDYKREFLDMYGVEIINEDFGAKSLFLITKEGTLFYKDTPKNLEDSFNLELFYINLNNALQCYSGITKEEMGI